MVVLLIGMAITAIWMSVALPAWRQQVQRQREEDLIFRGEQYARAIMLYQDKNQGANPPSVDILVSQHYLRKKWKDPITNDDFVPQGLGAALPGSAPGAGTPGQGPGRSGTTVPGGQGGVTGVRSKSQAASIKIYENQQQHNLWPFDAAVRRARTGRPAPTAPGQGQGPRGGGPGRGGDGRGGDQQIIRPPGAPGAPGAGRPGPGRGGPPVPPPPGRGRGGGEL